MKITSSFVILIVLAMSLPVFANGLNVWLYGDTDFAADGNSNNSRTLSARLGYHWADCEIGASISWYPDEQVQIPQTYTVYGLYNGLPAVDVPNPIPVEWLPDKFNAKPYFGAQVGLDVNNNGVITGPIAGLIVQDLIVVEYQYQRLTERLGTQLDNEHKVLLGLKIKIP